jgi:hypothetical protein
MKRLLENAWFDVLFIAALWYGLVEGIEWVGNIALFTAWFIAVVFILACFRWNTLLAAHLKEKQSYGPRTWYFKVWDWSTDIIMSGILVATGHWWTAGFFFTAVMLKQAMSKEADVALANPAKPNDGTPPGVTVH